MPEAGAEGDQPDQAPPRPNPARPARAAPDKPDQGQRVGQHAQEQHVKIPHPDGLGRDLPAIGNGEHRQGRPQSQRGHHAITGVAGAATAPGNRHGEPGSLQQQAPPEPLLGPGKHVAGAHDCPRHE